MPNDRTPITFDQVYLQNRSHDLERILIIAICKSFRFYNQISKRLCPIIPMGTLLIYRPDFTEPAYNQIYPIVASFWKVMSRIPAMTNNPVSWDWIEGSLAHEISEKGMPLDVAQGIKDKIKEDLETIQFDPELLRGLSSLPIVGAWLESRAAAYEIKRLSPAVLGRQATGADFDQARKRITLAATDPGKQVVSVASILNTVHNYALPYTVTPRAINDLIGGGLRAGQTTVVGAISGGGKTILTMQWADDFINQKLNILVLTTEQPPEQLMRRLLSNHMQVDFSVFQKRVERASNGRIAGIELPFIPDECWGTTPESWDAMNQFSIDANQHLKFIDWSSSSRTLISDFDDVVTQVMDENPGWVPHGIIVDWVGGGLDLTGNKKDSLRLFYKEAGEAVISYGKRHNCAMIMMAQLSKTLVRPGTKYITMDMLAECKSLVDNAWNFIGLTAIRGAEDDETSAKRLRPMQNICADKAREGKGGVASILTQFEYQRFTDVPKLLRANTGQ